MKDNIRPEEKKTEPSHPCHSNIYGIKYNPEEYSQYLTSHPYTKKQIAKMSKISKVSVGIIVYILNSLGRLSCHFFTISTQKHLASVSGYSLSTVKKVINAARRVGFIHTKHRYIGEGMRRRRTSSITTLVAFIKYAKWLSTNTIRLKNNKHIMISKVKKLFLGETEECVMVDIESGEVLATETT